MTSELFPIEAEIVAALEQAATTLLGQPNSAWTQAFKLSLRGVGHSHGFEVWGSLPDDGNNSKFCNEWLCDLCWLRCDRGLWQHLSGMALACEIEWKSDDESLLEDFLKLTVVDSEWRLFVFTARPGKMAEQFKLLRGVCPGSRGNRYLTIAVDGPPFKLHHQSWAV